MIKKRNPGRLPKALLETAADMRRAGVVDAAGREKIVPRLEGARLVRPVEDLDDGTLKVIAASEVPPEYAALDDLLKDWNR